MLSFSVLLLLVNGTALPAWGADLTKIARTIDKEPTSQGKPKYCLLVFGPEAKTRIWLVLDGNVLYVDRNGNGDLTEKGERFVGGSEWRVGDITEVDGKTRHTNLTVRFMKDLNSFLLYLDTAEKIHQEVGNEAGRLQFAEKAQDAPIVHFAGPLTFVQRDRSGRPWQLNLGSGKEASFSFIALIGTPGLGKGTAAYCHHEDFETLKMVCEVEFPQQGSAETLRVRGEQTFY
jgi:hypothetical protein